MQQVLNEAITMEGLTPPKCYIYTEWKFREGFRYEEPFEYCNGIRLDFDTISNFYNIFNYDFSKALKESSAYNNALKQSLFYSEFWQDEESKIKAFNKIYEFNLNGMSGSGSVITPLFPFEVYLMNDGYEMEGFCEMNAIDPAFKLHILSNTRKTKGKYSFTKCIGQYQRFYKKGGDYVFLGFGYGNTNFYFKTNKSDKHFQVDNNILNYKKAINGKLKPI